ncbi:DUF6537 domain-containing protein, partial [Salmonella enterica]|uniref:DUF6537 domain-containing protein n=1 Tax=Salmonella enterica TaxID=28901 RepID=UPI0034D6BF1C
MAVLRDERREVGGGHADDRHHRAATFRQAFAQRLRGTALDPFGRTQERRTERALIQEYRQCIEGLLAELTPERLA